MDLLQGDHDFAVPWCIKSTVEYIKFRYDNFPMYVTQTGKIATVTHLTFLIKQQVNKSLINFNPGWGIEFNNETEEYFDDDERVEFFETYYQQLYEAIE